MRVTNVSKRFKLHHQVGSGPLKELLFPWKRDRYYDEFRAVRDVSLEVRRGEVVGIIGPNGAGKSTLLKMVAGLLPIDEGTIEIDGKVTAVMAMGVGVHPEFSGRENILYGAMLMGMSKREVLRKMPGITEFAELGDYIERPLRTYSSGMTARLLFSIAMSVDPDILIVDEALATGDHRFVSKCIGRIREFSRNGATILFVSHDMALIQNLCDRAVLMEQGRVLFEGLPGTVVERYRGWNDPVRDVTTDCDRPWLVEGSGDIVVHRVRLLDTLDEETYEFHNGGDLRIELEYERFDPSIRSAHVTVGFLRADDQLQVGEISTWRGVHDGSLATALRGIELESRGRIVIQASPLLLASDHFTVFVRLLDEVRTHCEYRLRKTFFVREEEPLADSPALFTHPARIFHESRAASEC